MKMLKQIAEIVGLRYNEKDVVAMELLKRVEAKIPKASTPGSKTFMRSVEAAAKAVNDEGNMSIISLVKALTAPPLERVLKIKSSPKGARIKIAAANGVRFSFGPIWNASISKGKGIAFVVTNREKLNHQALMLGIESPEAMDVQTLAAAIAATF